MYLEGMGFRAIGRVLNVSNTAVLAWVKIAGVNAKLPQTNEPVEVAELDEMHTYIGKKKVYCWIWIAVDRNGHRYLQFVCGDRSTKTGLKLWDKMKDIPIERYTSDYWASYDEFIPPEKHLKTKRETYTVEGYNCRLRHYLARLHRKTLCYSKTEYMLELSLNLLMRKLNNRIAIGN
jgi:IS1 family transposase